MSKFATCVPRAFMMAVLLMLGSHAAQANNISFSFSNDPTGFGNIPGTVTGELDGLPADGTGPATAVIIDSYPVGLVSFGSYPTPFDVLTDWVGGSLLENNFTLVGGVITGGGFALTQANGINDQLFINFDCGNTCFTFGLGTGTNYLDIGSDNSLYVWNDDGIGPTGVTFGTAEAAAVPEPATLSLVAIGGLALLRRRYTVRK